MPTSATLLLREDNSSTSLATLVEKSQRAKHPAPYALSLTATHFLLAPHHDDEGFESDIDSLSLSDDSSDKTTTETDSANGSSDSDCDHPPSSTIEKRTETHHLADCVCYTDAKRRDVLLFVIRAEALVFRFDNLTLLRNFHLNFTALKALTNPKTLHTPYKFNLLQRTDNNGVTHIEITRDAAPVYASSIISINTPELRQQRYASSDNLVDGGELRKVWCSAEDLLAPKRPERRKKVKARAPPPPATPTTLPRPPHDVMRGEYVRVSVPQDTPSLVAKGNGHVKGRSASLVALLGGGSMPRVRSRSSEASRRGLQQQQQPMAYRYIDTGVYHTPASTMGNRLFGLSPKLRDFKEGRSGFGKHEAGLKSVIKKEWGGKKAGNEKKVTFSAYTTVQVV